jgi:hypothetical protein
MLTRVITYIANSNIFFDVPTCIDHIIRNKCYKHFLVKKFIMEYYTSTMYVKENISNSLIQTSNTPINYFKSGMST